MSHHRRDASCRRPHSRRRPAGATLPAFLVLVALAGVACGPTAPTQTPGASQTSPPPAGASGSPAASGAASPSASADILAIYAAIEDQVLSIRGLDAKAPVTPQILDDAGIKKLVADSFTKDNPTELIQANERILKAFGLLPSDASLTKLYIDLLGSQVAGLYDPETDRLYVVSKSGQLGVTEKSTFSHEFTHALQDQNFDLATLKLDEIGQGDRSFGRLALVEGDATLTMSYWQLKHLTQAEMGQLFAGAADDPSTKALLAMPAILRESLLFPYIQGLTFVQGIQAVGGWPAVDAVYAKPPASTEQILHPEKYAAGEQPVAVTIPPALAGTLGTGWKVALEDSFGEFQLGVWLRANKALAGGAAGDAAAGWGGDRIAVLNGPSGAWGVVLKTAWDTDADATAFEAAASSLVDGLASPASLLPGAGGRERWVVVGSDDATLNALAGALGLAG
jgi:hypothetical protein